MRTSGLVRLAFASLSLAPLLARADNSTLVRIDLQNAGIQAFDAEGTRLWFESLGNCFATATMTSSFQGTADDYTWTYTFSNLTPMLGTLGTRGQIRFDLSALQVSGRFDGVTRTTAATCSFAPTFDGSAYLPASAPFSFLLAAATDLTLTGGQLSSVGLQSADFARDSIGGPEHIRLQRAPTLRFTPIPAPGALTLALASGLAAARRRR